MRPIRHLPLTPQALKRRVLRAVARRRRAQREATLPLGMLDLGRSDVELRAARKIERIYHQGQSLAWEGRKVLEGLLEAHGGVQLAEGARAPIQHIFAIILWGELAAWKASARLAAELVPMDAKMAATSQAHDEARHFYVMHDYLRELGEVPRAPGGQPERLLHRVLTADHPAKLLLGMQLIVEPLALTLFSLVRRRGVDPVLDDLLVYYERDEARHVALGVLYLPEVLRKMGPLEQADLAQWQLRSYLLQFEILEEIAPHLRELGIDPREAMRLARKKQVQATQLLAEEIGRGLPVTEVFLRVVDFKAELTFPADERPRGRLGRTLSALGAATFGLERDHALGQGLKRAAL
jgi:hypothetical protein